MKIVFRASILLSKHKPDHYRKFGDKVGLGEWLHEVYTIV